MRFNKIEKFFRESLFGVMKNQVRKQKIWRYGHFKKIACYSDISSLIATKFLIIQFKDYSLNVSKKSRKSLYAFMLQTVPKKR